MSLPQRIAKNTGVLFFGQILTLIINLFVTIYLARYLGEEKYGLFSFAIVFINLFAIITNFGMKPIIIRQISSHWDSANRVLGASLVVKLFLAMISIFLAIICAITLGYERELILLIAIQAFNIIVSHKLVTFRFLFEASFESKLSMQKPVLFRLLDALLMIIFIFVLVELSASLQTIAVFYVLASVPGFILTMWYSVRHFPIKLNLNYNSIKWLFTESWPLAVYVALNALVLNIDVLLLKHFQDNIAVGNYSAAFRLTYPLNFIPMAIVMSLYPLMSQSYRDSQKRLVKLFQYGIKILLLLGFGLALGTTFIYREIITLLYANNFSDAPLPLMILMWAELFLFLNFFLVDFNNSINQQHKNTIAIAWMVFVNLAINLYFIPNWSVIGAGLAKLVTNMIGFGILYFYAYKNTGINILPIFLRFFPIALGFIILLYFIKNLNPVLVIVIAAPFYAGLIFLCRFFSLDETQTIFKIFEKFKLNNRSRQG